MKLTIYSRNAIGKQLRSVREDAKIPAVMYGPKYESTSVSLNAREFGKVFAKAGFSTMIDVVSEEGKAEKVLVKEIQQHPVNDNVLHVSLYVIDAKTPISAEVPVEVIGESPAEKLNLGFVAYGADSITVRCLPKDLPSNLTVDISKLKNPGDTIAVSDIELPEGVELDSKQDPHASVAYVAEAQKIEDVLAEIEADHAEEAAAETTEGETTEGGEGEAEEAAEGESTEE